MSLVAGYVQVMPAVYCGLFPTDAEQFEPLREALGRLQLNDAALQFEPEVSSMHSGLATLSSTCSMHKAVCRTVGPAPLHSGPVHLSDAAFSCPVDIITKLSLGTDQKTPPAA